MSRQSFNKRVVRIGQPIGKPRPEKKTPRAAATAAGVQGILSVSLMRGYGITPSPATPRRWTVSANLLVEVLL